MLREETGGGFGLGMEEIEAGSGTAKQESEEVKNVVATELIELCGIITEVENDPEVPSASVMRESIQRFKATNPHQDTQDFLASLAGHHPDNRYSVFVKRARQVEADFECPPMKKW